MLPAARVQSVFGEGGRGLLLVVAAFLGGTRQLVRAGGQSSGETESIAHGRAGRTESVEPKSDQMFAGMLGMFER